MPRYSTHDSGGGSIPSGIVGERRTTIIRATNNTLARYENSADESPEDTPLVLGQLFTDKGNPTKGLMKWRLKQQSGIKNIRHFDEIITFLIQNKIVEIEE